MKRSVRLAAALSMALPATRAGAEDLGGHLAHLASDGMEGRSQLSTPSPFR